MSLKKYYDKIIREHKEWIRNVEISFQNISWHFKKDEKKMLYCMIYLKSESKKLWFNHEETMFAAQQMWFNFIDFLLNLIENSMNQSKTWLSSMQIHHNVQIKWYERLQLIWTLWNINFYCIVMSINEFIYSLS